MYTLPHMGGSVYWFVQQRFRINTKTVCIFSGAIFMSYLASDALVQCILDHRELNKAVDRTLANSIRF